MDKQAKKPKPLNELTVIDLENMSTHELGDLLAAIVLVLKKLPNIPVERLIDEANMEA